MNFSITKKDCKINKKIRLRSKEINHKIYIFSKIYLTMPQVDLTKISSRGQIVIPVNMRGEFKEGDTLLIIKNENTFLLKKASDLDEMFKEDLEFAKRTEEAYKKHENGNFKCLPSDKFLKELEKW